MSAEERLFVLPVKKLWLVPEIAFTLPSIVALFDTSKLCTNTLPSIDGDPFASYSPKYHSPWALMYIDLDTLEPQWKLMFGEYLISAEVLPIKSLSLTLIGESTQSSSSSFDVEKTAIPLKVCGPSE